MKPMHHASAANRSCRSLLLALAAAAVVAVASASASAGTQAWEVASMSIGLDEPRLLAVSTLPAAEAVDMVPAHDKIATEPDCRAAAVVTPAQPPMSALSPVLLGGLVGLGVVACVARR